MRLVVHVMTIKVDPTVRRIKKERTGKNEVEDRPRRGKEDS